MPADDRSPLAMAEGRIRKVAGVVVRQSMLIAILTHAGRSTASQVMLLRLHEANLVQEALACLEEPSPVPLPPRC